MTVAALAGASLATAQTEEPTPVPWYTIEIVIFERAQGLGIDEEVWLPDPGQPPLDGAVELSDAAALADEAMPGESIPLAFQLLAPDQFELGNLWRRLANSQDYEPLWHGAWRQPGFDITEAQPAHLRVWRPDQGSSNVDSLALFPVEAAIDGTVLLYRARYLHVLFYLLFSPLEPVLVTPPATPPTQEPLPEVEPEPDPATPIRVRFRLSASRRMRSKETHYVDHPLFGILVRVTPFELPAAEESSAPQG